jgi:hypothetical protein
MKESRKTTHHDLTEPDDHPPRSRKATAASHLHYDEETRATHGEESYSWEEIPRVVESGSGT